MSVYQLPAVQMHLVMIPLVHLHAPVTLAMLVMDTVVQVKCSTIFDISISGINFCKLNTNLLN